MKKTLLLFFLLLSAITFAQQQTVTYSVSPSTFDETAVVTGL
jgi:hypothetical protein